MLTLGAGVTGVAPIATNTSLLRLYREKVERETPPSICDIAAREKNNIFKIKDDAPLVSTSILTF